MSKPIVKLKVEIWESANAYLKHGAPWYMWLAWFLTNQMFYHQMRVLAKNKTFYARGIYDKFHDKIILCINDIAYSSVSSLNGQPGKYHTTFALQTYFTLIHELLHKSNVAKDESNGGHTIDFDLFEKLHPSLKDMFDGLLELEYSNDAFNNHPENRRDKK